MHHTRKCKSKDLTSLTILKELAEELYQDQAVLSRSLGKLRKELTSKPKLRDVGLYVNSRTGRRTFRAQEIDKFARHLNRCFSYSRQQSQH